MTEFSSTIVHADHDTSIVCAAAMLTLSSEESTVITIDTKGLEQMPVDNDLQEHVDR